MWWFSEPVAIGQGYSHYALQNSERAREVAERAHALMEDVVLPIERERAGGMAAQCCGANGIGKDLPLSDFYESVRTFRIVDGTDEVHRRVIARATFEDVSEAELEPLTRFGIRIESDGRSTDDSLAPGGSPL